MARTNLMIPERRLRLRMRALGKQTISAGQLAILYVSYMIGSSIINIPNPMIHFAGNMAWLSITVSALMGMLLLSLVLYLFRCYPDDEYTACLNRVYGRWIAGVFIVLLILMLFLMLAYIILDIGDFFTNTMMVETPMYVFNTLTIVVAAYTVYAGIEVMGRMFFLLMGSMMLAVVLIVFLAVPLTRTETLLPLFTEGIKPVLHGIYFSFGFPFGELFLFSVILPFVRKDSRRDAGKWLYAMTALSGFLLLIVILITVMTLGPLAGDRKFSLYAVARLIKVGNFMVGLEAIVGIALIAGSFTKATIVLFILNYVTARFFKLDDDKLLLPAISFITFLLSMTMFRTEDEFSFAVQVGWPFIVMTVGIVPLMLAALITLLRRNMGRR
ncbi:MAG: spore gernimation protein [Paenibacillaceae bacterium]|nr:MAG: spore gernimation protein [Paenibacillaceae bacterium]